MACEGSGSDGLDLSLSGESDPNLDLELSSLSVCSPEKDMESPTPDRLTPVSQELKAIEVVVVEARTSVTSVSSFAAAAASADFLALFTVCPVSMYESTLLLAWRFLHSDADDEDCSSMSEMISSHDLFFDSDSHVMGLVAPMLMSPLLSLSSQALACRP